MSISEMFYKFCKNIDMRDEGMMADIYIDVTLCLNRHFWNSISPVKHRIYAGIKQPISYTRNYMGDVLYFRLPYFYYEKYNRFIGNGQLGLIDEIKDVLQKEYPDIPLIYDIDGITMDINQRKNIKLKVIPTFVNENGSYTYPVISGSGRWEVTKFILEIEEFNKLDELCNGNLMNLSKMIKVWSKVMNLNMDELLIDVLCYNFMLHYEHKSKDYMCYDWISRDFFKYLSEQNPEQEYWIVPGSLNKVYKKDDFIERAKITYLIARKACLDGYDLDKNIWQNIYGRKFVQN